MNRSSIIPGKNPWRPWVSGVYGVFLGPLAAGIISHRNFIRLGNPAKGRVMLILSLIFGITLWVVSGRLNPENISNFKHLFQSAAGAVFPLFQLKDFENWKSIQGGAGNPSNGWSAFGWGMAGLLLFIVLISGLVSISVLMG